jgi:tight adherence protein C
VFLLLFLAKDRDLEKETEKRSRELVLSYPSFVSKFTLLAGAGMTVPFIFQTMEKEEKNPYLAMELKLFCRDMKNEMLEPALDKFGKRCGSALYLKFCALLIQNVKKGTKDFLPMLREEAASAFLLQKQQVKKAGEEAGTKLLFPMVLLLLLVMLLIMIPAFLSFSVS